MRPFAPADNLDTTPILLLLSQLLFYWHQKVLLLAVILGTISEVDQDATLRPRLQAMWEDRLFHPTGSIEVGLMVVEKVGGGVADREGQVAVPMSDFDHRLLRIHLRPPCRRMG